MINVRSGITDTTRNTLFRQIHYIYSKSDVPFVEFACTKPEVKIAVTNLLNQMVKETSKLIKLNPDLILLSRDTVKNERESRLLDAMVIVKELDDSGRVISDTIGTFVKQAAWKELCNFEGPNDVEKIVTVLKYIWMNWEQVWDAWDRHCNGHHHTNHDLTYFFHMLAEDDSMEIWLPMIRKASINSDSQCDDFYDHCVQNQLIECVKYDGPSLEQIMRVPISPRFIQTVRFDQSAVIDIVKDKQRQEWTMILKYMAAVECGLGRDFWYQDVLDVIFKHGLDKHPQYQFRFSQDCELKRGYELTMGVGWRSERKKWMRHIPQTHTFIYVSSLLNVMMLYKEDHSVNALDEDLNVFESIINEANRIADSQGILVFTNQQMMTEMIQIHATMNIKCLKKRGSEEEYIDNIVLPSYNDGLKSLDNRPKECQLMSNDEWLQYCVHSIINYIQSLFLAIPGSSEFVKSIIIVEHWNTLDVAEKLLCPEIFEIIDREMAPIPKDTVDFKKLF